MKTIAVDIDEVLAASAEGFVKFSNQRWGTSLTVDDYDEHWAEMWNISKEEAEKRFDIYSGEKIVRGYRALTEAKEILKKLSGKFRLVIATSRSSVLNEDTVMWIDQHFPEIFENIHHSGIYDKPGPGRHLLTKADLLQEIGADYLIDDQTKHCIGATQVGVKAILFGDYSWNNDVKLPPGIVRCKNWQEVGDYFNGKA
jgi:5'(3')-deoxyribonucleotidase